MTNIFKVVVHTKTTIFVQQTGVAFSQKYLVLLQVELQVEFVYKFNTNKDIVKLFLTDLLYYL